MVEWENCIPSRKLAALTAPSYSVVRIPWDDGAAPWALRRNFWFELAKWLTDQKRDVIVCCMGGHGRTGTAIIMLTAMLNQQLFKGFIDPISWLRKVYCDEVVETYEQIQYLELQLNMKMESKPSWVTPYTVGGKVTSYQHPWASDYRDDDKNWVNGTPSKIVVHDDGTKTFYYQHDHGLEEVIEEPTSADICNDCEAKAPGDCYGCDVWLEAVGAMVENRVTNVDDEWEEKQKICESCYDHHQKTRKENDMDCRGCNLWMTNTEKDEPVVLKDPTGTYLLPWSKENPDESTSKEE